MRSDHPSTPARPERVAPPPGSIPLWQQLQAAAGVLAAVRAGESATPAIARVPSTLRPAAQSLAFQGLRNLGRAMALRQRLAPRAPPPRADALLLLALALAWRVDAAPYEPHTLVDQAVEAAKRDAATARQAAFVNACLRRFLREQDALVAATDADPVARWNHPRWWIERVKRDHPDAWPAILEADGVPAPMVLRVFDPEHERAQEKWTSSAIDLIATPVGEQGVMLQEPRPVTAIPGFAEGRVSVQDAGAQLAAPMLVRGLAAGPRGGNARPRILDACAAPGGKTAHLLERLPGAELLALDIDPARCARIEDNLRRVGVGVNATIRAADALAPATWWDGRPFDAILLDAPCTASGIVRRHPDVPWLRREDDVPRLAALQQRLLATLWPLLAPGGVLVYCTCSVFHDEGEAVVRSFLAHHKDVSRHAAPGHLRPQNAARPGAVPDNVPGDHDGFFYALLERTAAG